MKCLIVDDELLARDLLVEYIEKIDRLLLVKVCSDAIEEAALFFPVWTSSILFSSADKFVFLKHTEK